MASQVPPPNGSKFKLFSRSRGKSPAPRKKDPPPVLTFGPPSPHDRWEAESDGDAQEFRANDATASTSEQTTPIARVLTAPATLVHSPAPRYPLQPLHPQTASHTAQFLAPSPLLRPGELQHPFSANYEYRSLESESEQATANLRRNHNQDGRRPTPVSRDTRDTLRTRPQMRALSPDARQRLHAPSPAPLNRRAPANGAIEGAIAEGEEVNLDVYPWFIFQEGDSGETNGLKSPSEDCSFISL